jgi:hypothetical protein
LSLNKRRILAVPRETGYIPLRKALKDYLKEQGIALSDLLGMMDEERKGLMEALRERVQLTDQQSRFLEQNFSSRDLNLLLFVAQAYYLLNPSGMYKGMVVEPTRGEVVWGEKISYEGCRTILKTLLTAT